MSHHKTITGVDEAALAYFLAQHAPPVCFIARDQAQVEQLKAEIPFFKPEAVVVDFPAWDVQPYDRLAPDLQIQSARMATVRALQTGEVDIVLTTVNGASLKCFPQQSGPLLLKVGLCYTPQKLAEDLVHLGLVRVETVTEPGEFALRGAVFDVFPPLAEVPVRLDYFDDEIEDIKTFDPLTQRSDSPVVQIELGVAGEVQLTPAYIQTFREKYRQLFPQGVGDTLYEHISEGYLPPEALHFLPLFCEAPLLNLFELLPDNITVIAGETFDIALTHRAEEVADAFHMRAKLLGQRDEVVYRPIPPDLLYLTTADWEQQQQATPWQVLKPFGDGCDAALKAHVLPVKLEERLRVIVGAIQEAKTLKQTVVFSAPSQGHLVQIERVFGQMIDAPENVLHGVTLQESAVAFGFTAPDFVMFTDQDILGPRQGQNRVGQRKKRQGLTQLADLRPGDYVVHEEHGIGQFVGLETMQIPTLQGKTVQQDFIKLHYAPSGGDKHDRVFVPVEALGLISRHSSAEAGVVQLDKLGGAAWQARKAKIKKDLLLIAGDLMKTAAARDMLDKEPLPTPPGLYDDFVQMFPYQTTGEQQASIDSVLADMAETHPMDRLVVGDVGFGKTEVALRAAMVAVGNGKQVAVIAPTTLLARQHFEVFTKRFMGFAVNIRQLSRFVSSKQAKDTKMGMQNGTVDIVIGTHALLAKDIKFKALGLLVIDEEQRFGVTHKEKLKTLKANVDVLTLTATPIPRTLHMASGGLKQLSTITTPPVDRLAVRSFILPWDPKTMREAVLREIHRGGQVYVVTPRVQDIPKLVDALASLVPEAKIKAAHGQMPERDLEEIMDAFYHGDFQVLVATTIIESGLDIPKANTLIVNRADKFGLAQLHQLRGRVGRSTVRAYAYFVLPEGQMSDMATRRLKILQRLDGLGAGFQLASFDMDLRGAGNLLGKEQSGHIQDVGFELYTKMLAEAVADLKVTGTEHSQQHFTPQLNLGLSYLIPDSYVTDLGTRMQLYRRLADVDEAGIEDIRAELADRFGPVPGETKALLQVVAIRNQCQVLNILKLDVGPKGIVIRFFQNTFAQPEGLMRLLQEQPGLVTLGPDQSLVFHKATPREAFQRLQMVSDVLAQLAAL